MHHKLSEASIEFELFLVESQDYNDGLVSILIVLFL